MDGRFPQRRNGRGGRWAEERNANNRDEGFGARGRGHARGARGAGRGRGGRGGTHQWEEREINPMGFRKVQELMDEEDLGHLLQKLVNTRSGFVLRLSALESPSPLFLANIIRVIAKTMPYKGAPDSLYQLLNVFRNSHLLKMHLVPFFVSMMSSNPTDEIELFRRVARDLMPILNTLLRKMPTSWVQVYPVVTIMERSFKGMKDDDVSTAIGEVIEQCNDLKDTIQAQAKPKQQRETSDEFRHPPNDFKEMSVVPSNADILGTEPVFLRANKETGAYNDLPHYLDVQFRLLREDFIRPLREGIAQYLRLVAEERRERNTDIRVYESVQILYPLCTSTGVSYRICFDIEKLRYIRWQSSKRLIFGSLVCLSKDNFNTMIFATVCNRDPKHLENGELDVHFEHDLQELDAMYTTGDVFIMAETTAYFEAYRHVLQGLKTIDNDLPFQRYLVEGKKETRVPRYIQMNESVKVDLSVLCQEGADEPDSDSSDDEDLRRLRKRRNLERLQSVRLLRESTWPSAEEMHLDATQHEALKAALTRELAIIQGPPGTGKTYLGLKIVRALLRNENLWNRNRPNIEFLMRELGLENNEARNENSSPILVVCYTNHALDQFLEGIQSFCKTGIVRVGGRSKSELMDKFNLRTLRQEMRRRSNVPGAIFLGKRDIQRQMQILDNRMDQVSTQLASCEKGILHEDVLEPVMRDRHYNDLVSLYQGEGYEAYYQHTRKRQSFITEWLGLGDTVYQQEAEEDEQDQADAEQPDEELDVDEDAEIAEAQRMLDLDDENPLRQRHMEHLHNMAAAEEHLAFNMNAADERAPPPGQEQQEVWQIQKQAKKKRNRKILRQLRSPAMMTEEEQGGVRNIWTLNMPNRWRLYRLWIHKHKTQLRGKIRTSEIEYQQAANRYREILNEEDKGIMKTAKVLGMTTTGAAKYRNILQEVKPKIIIVEEAAEVLEAHIVTTLSEGCQHLILIGDHKQLRPNPTVYELAEKYKLKVSLFERLINNGMECVTLGEQHRMRPEISHVMKHIYPHLQDHESVNGYDNVLGVSTNMFFLDHRFQEDHDSELKSKSNYHEAKFIASLCNYLILQGYQTNQITVLTGYTGQVLLLKKHMPKKGFSGVRISAIDNYQGEENDIILLSLVRSNKERKAGFLKEDNRLCVALSRAKMGLYVIGNFQLLEESSRLWSKVLQTVKDNEAFGRSLALYCQNHPHDAKLQVQHSRDFENAPEGGCKKPCEYRLNCGHVCERMCHSYDKDHKNYICQKPCGKKLCVVAEHSCRKKCGKPCGNCAILVHKLMPLCGHKQYVPCHVSPNNYICKEVCGKQLGCGHGCTKTCGENCTEDCRFEVEKTLPCRHTVSIKCFQVPEKVKCPMACGEVLECGHPCPGTCGSCFGGRIHVSCRNNCGRTLVCGHQCKVKCTRECPPCGEPCENRCVHSECQQRCGQECVPCREPCAWTCKHQTCTRMCHESCNRERCNSPCEKTLRCGHPCIGLCGETCPSKCRVCHADEVGEIFFGIEDEDDARFVQLQDCGHIFEVSGLDRWMDMAADNSDRQEDLTIQMKKCPKCSVVIRKNLRYGSIINQLLCDIEEVKRIVLKETRDELRNTRTRVSLENMDLFALDKTSFGIFESRISEESTYGELQCVGYAIAYVRRLCKLGESLGKTFPSSKLKSPSQGFERYAKLASHIFEQMKLLSAWATKVRMRFSDQEIAESQKEVERISMFIELLRLAYNIKYSRIKIPIEVSIQTDKGLALLEKRQRLGEDAYASVKKVVEKLHELGPLSGLGISEEERQQLLQWAKTTGVSQGGWYKCKNGHIYAIGECGGANQESKCPECGVKIGGTGHRLAEGNEHAGEMDGTRFAAWSEQANMENYGHDIRF